MHAAKVIENQVIQTLNQKALKNYTSINKRLLTSIPSSSKALRRSKKTDTWKLLPNKLRIVYANARSIKSKMQSLKQVILPKPCHIFTITKILSKK